MHKSPRLTPPSLVLNPCTTICKLLKCRICQPCHTFVFFYPAYVRQFLLMPSDFSSSHSSSLLSIAIIKCIFDPLNLFSVNCYYIKPTRRFSDSHIAAEKNCAALADTLLFAHDLLLQLHIRITYWNFDTSLLQTPDIFRLWTIRSISPLLQRKFFATINKVPVFPERQPPASSWQLPVFRLLMLRLLFSHFCIYRVMVSLCNFIRNV